jgi:HEPN domain-containing protein
MGEDGSVQAYLALSLEYLQAAEEAHRSGRAAPASFMAVHALELGVKAALARLTGTIPRTHNVGGEFGKHLRGRVAPETTRRLNRLLSDYGEPRYPEWVAPGDAELADDLAFIGEFLRVTLPPLIEEARA